MQLKTLIFLFMLFTLLLATLAQAGTRKFRLHLQWNPVAGVAKYKVQIAKEKDFTSIIEEKIVDEPEWDWNYESAEETPALYYRVASVGDDGIAGGFSRAKPLELPA